MKKVKLYIIVLTLAVLFPDNISAQNAAPVQMCTPPQAEPTAPLTCNIPVTPAQTVAPMTYIVPVYPSGDKTVVAPMTYAVPVQQTQPRAVDSNDPRKSDWIVYIPAKPPTEEINRPLEPSDYYLAF